MKKKLYRNTDEKMIAGVLAGVAYYFGHDLVLYRLGFLLLLALTVVMPGVFIYFVAWVLIPERPLIEPLSKDEYRVYN